MPEDNIDVDLGSPDMFAQPPVFVTQNFFEGDFNVWECIQKASKKLRRQKIQISSKVRSRKKVVEKYDLGKLFTAKRESIRDHLKIQRSKLP